MWQQLKQFIDDGLQATNREHQDFLRSSAASRPDVKTIVVLVSTAILLTFQNYAVRSGDSGWTLDVAENWLPSAWAVSLKAWATAAENRRLFDLTYWAIGQQIVYVVVPVAIIKLVFRERLADYGVKLRGMWQYVPLYTAMALVMLPLVLVASHGERFQETYPFYKLAPGEPLWPRFFAWEALYILQFMALEFFFRGYVLHGVRRRFGAYAIFVMMIPYCMIHFGKPMPETCGAIAAGIVLGFMSLKTRSIWMGALLHIAVALAMDFAALARR
jgi:membrane protease YdiL (CAAX protease family)